MRQGEAETLINYINKYSFHSLLSRNTKTWQSGDIKIIINLILALTELAEEIIRYGIYYTNHGSDYQMIEIEFNILVSDQSANKRLLLKNTP